MKTKMDFMQPTSRRTSINQLMIMIHLLEKPKYGYEILRDMRDDFQGTWIPKTGTIYPALKTLTKRGLIKTEQEGDTEYYSMTKQGREFLSNVSSDVAEYMIFNRHFIESSVNRMPSNFTQQVFEKIHSSGMNEVMPEKSIVEAILRLPDKSLSRIFLEARKQVLKDKLKLIQESIDKLGK